MSQRTLSGVFDKIALERQKQQPAPDAKQVDEIEEYHSYLTAATNHILNNEMSVDDSAPVVTGGRLTGRKRPADTPIELLEGQELQDDDGDDDDDDDVEVHEGGAPRDKSPEQLRIELLHEHLQALFAVFPDCDEHFLYQKLLEYDSNDVTRVDRVDLICNALLEKRDYPKRKAPEPTKPTLSEEEAYKEQENTFKSTTRTVSPLYRQLVYVSRAFFMLARVSPNQILTRRVLSLSLSHSLSLSLSLSLSRSIVGSEIEAFTRYRTTSA